MTNHPVHVRDKIDETKNPTALIPFCEFGGNLSVMGIKIEQFDAHFCNSFRVKIIQDQLCYTVDPNEYKNEIDLNKDLSLSLFINYNEDKEIVLEEIETRVQDDSIIIETIGKTTRYLSIKL